MVKIYDDIYYEDRIGKGFIKNNSKLFKTKKIIFLFNILNYREYVKNKKFNIAQYSFYDHYTICETNSKILDNDSIKQHALEEFDFLKDTEFITYPVCIFENVTIECILIKQLNISDFFINKNKILSNNIFLVNNYSKNINLIDNILKVIINDTNKEINIKIENDHINIKIKDLFNSLIPYY